MQEPQQVQNYANFEEEKNNNNINLEDAVDVEKQLTKIYESLRKEVDPTLDCEDWWMATDPSTYTLNKLSMFFKDATTVKAIIQAQKLETIAVSLIQFLCVEPLDTPLWTPLKNLIFFIHQSCLVQHRFLIDRLPAQSKSNSWAKKIDKICESKLTKLFKEKAEALQSLKVNNSSAMSVLGNICKLKPKRDIYFSINVLLKEMDGISISKIREMMFNTIQYRDGKLIAMTIDQMNGFGANGRGAGGANSAQSFNPHTAAINSPSHFNFFDDDLPAVTEPFLPEGEPGVYTLVLDLDETLVHFFDMGPDSHFKIRPGCNEFLTELSKYYELVIFTAAMQDYADSVLDQIDKEGLIKYRLYRQHTSPYGQLIAKDLSKIGRDLSKSILVDNVADNFALQPDNGIFIKTWYDDMEDT